VLVLEVEVEVAVVERGRCYAAVAIIVAVIRVGRAGGIREQSKPRNEHACSFSGLVVVRKCSKPRKRAVMLVFRAGNCQ